MNANRVQSHFDEHIHTIRIVADRLSQPIQQCCAAVADALRHGHKVLIMGNGGSAADAQHFAAELVGRFLMERPALPAIALTTDTSILTAVGNDYGFDQIFKRQVQALAQPDDVVIGISTSGLSDSVYHALTAANEIGCKTVGLLGREGGRINRIVDFDLTVPVQATPHIQEAHMTIIHILCDLLEHDLFPQEGVQNDATG